MRRIVILAVIVSFVSSGAFAWMLKPVIGFGTLYEPKPEEIAGGSLTKGGMNFAVQGIFGEDELKYGGEIGQLSFYSFSLDVTGLEINSSMTAMPILGIVQYELGEGEGFSPYLQSGLGFFMTSVTSKATLLGVTVDASESGTNMGVVLGGGGTLPVGETMTLDFSLKYYYIQGVPVVDMPGELLNICVGLCFEM